MKTGMFDGVTKALKAKRATARRGQNTDSNAQSRVDGENVQGDRRFVGGEANGNEDAFYQDDWWLEHLEGEIEPNLKEDLELLLKNSRADRRILFSLKETRAAIKKSDDVALPESGLYYENLHNKIMSAIDNEESMGARLTTDAFIVSHVSKTRVSWKAMAGSFGMTMMVAALTWITVKSTDAGHEAPVVAKVEPVMETSEAMFERNLAMVSPDEAKSFSSELNSFVSEEDLVTDAAVQKLENLSDEEAAAFIASLER